MITTVRRAVPQPPPVAEIVLEVTPAELIALARAVGHHIRDRERQKLHLENEHGLTPTDAGILYRELQVALREAGLAR